MTHRHRSERLGELFRREITRLLLGSLKDPRLDGVTVTDVRATQDLSFATVYIRSDEDVSEGIEGLEHAVGFIRRELGRSLRLREDTGIPLPARRNARARESDRGTAAPGREDAGPRDD